MDNPNETLVAFLRARLDEDEAAARAAVHFDYGVKNWADDGDPVDVHIARHDPARVLREVMAARAILDLHSPSYPVTYPEPSGQPTCGVCHAGGWDWEPEKWPCPTVRALVAVYSDHPDYDQGWAP
jgi:Family of unknown function (DUF6221)